MHKRGFQPELFREVREKLYPSQRKFASELTRRTGRKLGQSHISAIERGVNEPSVSLLVIMAEMLGVTPDYLLGFEQPHQLQELTQSLAQLPEGDIELVWKLVNRLVDQRAIQESEWLSLWRDVARLGGQSMIGKFERVLGVSAPVNLRSGQDNTGMDNMDQLAKSVNGRLPVAG